MRWKEGALLVSVVVVGAVGAEILFRAARIGVPPHYPLRPRLADLYKADEHLGYTLWKSTNTCYRYPSFNPTVHSMNSNRFGFRSDREFDEPDDRTRILVLGDSFVQGVGVAVEDRFTDLVERKKPSWRVDSMGISGWGLDTMVRALELYGEKIEPDVVVVAMYTDDFRRLHPLYAGLGYHIPKFELVDGRLESYRYEMPRGFKRSRVYHAAREYYWTANQNQWDLNEALLDRFLANAERMKFKPAVVFLPGTDDNANDRARRAFLKKWTGENGVPYSDLTEPLLGPGADKTYWVGDFHWNEHGHEIASRELLKFLETELVTTTTTAPAP
jgi:hypothetical protein